VCWGHDRPHEVAHAIGYLPEERGLYPAMKAYEAIAFLGALRGLPLAEGRRRGRELLEEHGLGYAADRQIRQLSKGMAQQVQLLGTLVHGPGWWCSTSRSPASTRSTRASWSG
jgi:ABC-2 type transport system ATP-binding protein